MNLRKQLVSWNSFIHFILHSLKIPKISLMLCVVLVLFCQVNYFYIYRHTHSYVHFFLCFASALTIFSFCLKSVFNVYVVQ